MIGVCAGIVTKESDRVCTFVPEDYIHRRYIRVPVVHFGSGVTVSSLVYLGNAPTVWITPVRLFLILVFRRIELVIEAAQVSALMLSDHPRIRLERRIYIRGYVGKGCSIKWIFAAD